MSFNALDISASGLYAQRVKMDTVSSNIANVNTTRQPDGTKSPYVRKQVVFSNVINEAIGSSSQEFNSKVGMINKNISSNPSNMLLKANVNFEENNVSSGVKVSEVSEDKQTPFKKVYEPGHPDADENGFVNMPNINIVTEMVDMMSASRAYEANVTAMNASKSMISAAMKI